MLNSEQAKNADEYITIREAMTFLRVSEKRLREAIMQKEVPVQLMPDKRRRVGSWDRPVTHIKVADLMEWIEKLGGAVIMRKKA